jgi:hypothetical protein
LSTTSPVASPFTTCCGKQGSRLLRTDGFMFHSRHTITMQRAAVSSCSCFGGGVWSVCLCVVGDTPSLNSKFPASSSSTGQRITFLTSFICIYPCFRSWEHDNVLDVPGRGLSTSPSIRFQVGLVFYNLLGGLIGPMRSQLSGGISSPPSGFLRLSPPFTFLP